MMTQEELDKIVDRHQHWLKEDCEGCGEMRANDCRRLDPNTRITSVVRG